MTDKREKKQRRIRGLAKKVYESDIFAAIKLVPEKESAIEPPGHTRMILNYIELPAAVTLGLAYLTAAGYYAYNAASKVPDLANQVYQTASDACQYVEPYVEQIEGFFS